MKYRIGYRTTKTAIGTAAAIIIAQQLGATNFAAAGILTILCIKPTQRKSLRTAWDRFLACMLAMPFSAAFFEILGYHPTIIGLMLFFFIPTLVMLKANDGIVTSSVIILHIYSAGHVSKDLFLNEFLVISVGIGVALLMNLYMPSLDKKLFEYSAKIEENFQKIFMEMANYLRTNEGEWDGREISETARLLNEAKSLAYRDVENHLVREENLYYHYFTIREKQFDIIKRILPISASLGRSFEQGKMVADFIEELSKNIHEGNPAFIHLHKLRQMKMEFEEMDLPKTREEFEARAALVQLTNELEQYLVIKSPFRGLHKPEEKNRKAKIGTN
ncbi:aromatic acid exporter family protein [Neobacillus notoginsengisoli]|uniref:Aromatic acid exporter family protein n=1 Tax=Neobacillus notoginsengisoli TaxID=1578198 RepID=A0A417YV19_9BACI|nr:aromatic acid exporter family protein [Neobacillus notoginsengisoli]RHW41143.1 aromatic acid exporter family protein [Neobacillus notoginsengisoli]